MVEQLKELLEIRNFLIEKSNDKAKNSWRKFVPGSEKVYGVYLSEINKVVSKYVSGGFELVEELWNSGYLEERIFAAKILGRISKKNPEKVLKLIRVFAEDIVDWAVCDTLATQGVRGLVKIKQQEIFEISKEFVKSDNLWKRRFGVVLLINYRKDVSLSNDIKEIISFVEKDNEYYVKKAVEWVKRSLN